MNDEYTNLAIERKIHVNKWLIKARWFYVLGIFGIGIFSKSIVKTHIDFSYSLMFSIVFFFIVLNSLLCFLTKNIQNNVSRLKINFLGVLQLSVEIIAFTFIMNRSGGIEGVVYIFFILPTISASLLFGVSGAVITSLVSALFVDLLVIGEYFGYIKHYARYAHDTIEFTNLKISLAKMTIVSIFYLMVGAFSGFSSSLLFEKEKDLSKKEKKLNETRNLLIQKGLKLSKTNKELDYKIKELKKAQKTKKLSLQKLKEEKNKMSAIISNFIDPIIVLDKDGNLLLTNPIGEKIFDLEKKYLGKKIFEEKKYSMEYFINRYKLNYDIKNNDDPNIEEISFVKNKEEITYKIITTKIFGPEKEFLGTMKIFYNLSREKMVDKLKSQFITIAAHQLRTPLSAVKWAISLVIDEELGKINEKQKEMLFKGFRSNERVINLINDMLYVSRIEEGKFGYSFEYHDFNELLDKALKEFQYKIKEKKITFIINKEKEKLKVYADKEKMLLVLKNLIKNSVEYTPESGKIIINIKKEEKILEFTIKDNGVGIPKEDQDKIFSKFFRAQNVLRIQTEGSGLGLFISRNIIEKHGGKLSYQSEEGIGSEFKFTLPLEK